eukprot:COSAG04_NODE_6822_length_1248_cov_2.358573_2_plen_309_part_01
MACIEGLAMAGGTICCPKGIAMWSSQEFKVTSGSGGAVRTAGPIAMSISDTVFRTNAAPKGATLSMAAADSVRITNTTVDAPEDGSSGAVWLTATTIDGCSQNPCASGSQCSFRDHSTFCEACGPNEIGADGVSCQACRPGTQPDATQTGCLECPPAQHSSIGICSFCSAGKTSSEDRTGCTPCEPGTHREAEEPACELCALGLHSADGVECTACPAGKSPTNARDGCTPCSAGTYSADGLDCQVCPAGSQPNAGKTGCDSCFSAGPNAYSPDGRECRDCPARNAPNYERTACFCQAETYSAVELGLIS